MPVLVSGKVKRVFCGGVSGVFSVVFFVIFRWDGGLAADGECVVFFVAWLFFLKSRCFVHFGKMVHMQCDTVVSERENNR